MARNLQERLATAKSSRARISDNETLIVDLKAEQQRLGVAREQAAAESVDFALSEEDRDEAAAKAGRLDRTIKALDREIAEVAALTEERRNDDARKAAEAEKRAALTERNEIAARFAERIPALTAEMIEIFKAVKANADRMRAAGVYEANAEFHARGIPGNGLIGGISPAMVYAEMKVPEFRGAGRAWPIDYDRALIDRGAELTHRARLDAFERADREREDKAKAAEEYRRTHGRYEITVESSVEEPEAIVHFPAELVTGSIPAALGCWDRRELMIPHDIAKKLAAVPKVKVKRLDAEAAQ
jgi:hypothetical protein